MGTGTLNGPEGEETEGSQREREREGREEEEELEKERRGDLNGGMEREMRGWACVGRRGR
jgi:hypothetical protein